jgi:hypothetical protein
MDRVILLTSDLPGEDEAYTIGAVLVPETVSTEDFEKEAVAIMDEIRQQDCYDDDELLTELGNRGYKSVVPPESIVVRQ